MLVKNQNIHIAWLKSMARAKTTAISFLNHQSKWALLALFIMPSSALAALGAAITATPATIYPGQIADMVVTLSNDNSTAAISGVAFNKALTAGYPNGLKVAGVAVSTCGGAITAPLNGQAISFSGGSVPIAPNASTSSTCTITIPVTAGTNTGSSASYSYGFAAGEITADGGLSNTGAASQGITVSALAKPTINKFFQTPTLTLGGNGTYLEVEISNSNAVPIPNFTVTDIFPQLGTGIIKVDSALPHLKFCSSGPAPSFIPAAPVNGATQIGGTGTLPANGSCTFKIFVVGAHTNGAYTTGAQTNTINAATQFTNDLGIPAAANATADVTVNSPLRITKTVDDAAIASGQPDFFTITLHNDGLTALPITSFTDSPIDGGGIGAGSLTVTGQSTTCGGSVAVTAGNKGVTQTGGSIPAGGSCAITINFTGTTQAGNTPTTYTNTIAQGAVNVGNPAIVSQARSATVTIYDTLNVGKSVTPTNAAPGAPVKYTVTVQNWATTAQNNLVINDALTNGQTFLTGTINGINYTPTVTPAGCGAVTTTNVTGNNAAVLTVGTLPARVNAFTPGTCSVSFWAKTNTAGGAYNNQLAAGTVCYNAGATCNGGASNNVTNTTLPKSLVVDKSFSQGGTTNPPSALSRSEGTIVRMAIALSNYSVNPLTNVSISDTLPTSSGQQLLVATPSNASTTCGGTITAVAGTSSVGLNNGTVPARAGSGAGAAGACTLFVDVVGSAGVYDNTATVTASEVYADNTAATVNASSNQATVTYLSALGATKSFVPASVSSGGKSRLTIRLTNAGAVALTNVAVTDTLPTGMTVANPANANTSCAGTTTITATPAATSASLTGASIAGGGTCDLVLDVVATGSANWVNTILKGGITADGGVINQTPVIGTLNLIGAAGVDISKFVTVNGVATSNLAFPGQIAVLTINIANNNAAAVTGLKLTDYFTLNGTSGAAVNGWAVGSTPAASTTCPAGIVTAVPGGTSVALTGATMAATTTCTITVNVTSNKTGAVTNIIPVNSIVTDQGFTNGTFAQTSLNTGTSIGIVKQFTPNVVKPGERSRLRITISNPASQAAANVSVIDTLPAGVTVPPGPNPTNTCGATVTSPASNQVQIAGGNLPAASAGGVAASCYAEIDVTVAAQGDYVNTIPAGALSAVIGGLAVTNSQPTSDTLHAKTPLSIHKAFSGLTLDAGNPVGFTTGSDTKALGAPAVMTIRLDNANNVALTGAAFTDNLPAGLVVAIAPNASTTCAGGVVTAAASATNVKLTGATIPANGNCTVTVSVLSNIAGSYTNTIPAGAVTTIEGASNDEPTSARLLTSTPPTVTKQFLPAVIPPNGISTLTINLGNTNASAITLTSLFTDTLPTAPGAITVAATPSIGGTCTTASVTAAAGAGTVTYANGATIPAGGCTITVNVTGVIAGDYTNNIPAGELQTNFGNNQAPANAVLKISTLGFISGRVFQDNNAVPNGTFQSGTDTPIQGNTIELRSGANCTGALVGASVTTDALGNYLFSGLPAGVYSVCQPNQPPATTNGITTAGTINPVNGSTGTVGTATSQAVVPSAITNIVLNANGTGEISGSPNNNFAEVVLSSIAGKVFLDQNNNGTQQGADAGIAGVTIELLNSANAVVAITTTDADGNYAFNNLVPGTYSVREPTQPTGTSNGITTAGAVPNGGTPGVATPVATTPSRISTIVLPPNTASTANNFAEIPNGRSLSGLVFLDYDNSALVNGPDHGIGGQTINLIGTDVNSIPVTRTTTTAPDGTYSFIGLPEGTYRVEQPAQPAGTTNGTTIVGSTGGVATAVGVTPSVLSAISLLGANTVSANNNFAEIPGAAPDLTIGKTHTPVTFGAGSTTAYFTVTPSNIGALATSGVVTVVDTMPAGITPTAATGTGWTCGISGQIVTCTSSTVIAANGGLGNPITLNVSVATGLDGQLRTNTAVISGGGEPPGFDGNNTAIDTVAIATVARLSGLVWMDTNHDRIPNAPQDEPRLKDWTVELLYLGSVIDTVKTDATGAYAFTNINPGSGYTVRFRHPTTGLIWGNAVTNEQGIATVNGARDSATANAGTNAGNPAGATLTGDGTLPSLTLIAGDNIVQQSLPIDPAGVVYNAITRQPVAGAVVTIAGPGGFNPAIHLVGGGANVTTGADGMYQFLLTPTAPAGTYTLTVTTYPGGYLQLPSALIPVCAATLTVGAAPDPALVQNSSNAPLAAIPAHNPAACPATSAGLAAGAGTTQYFSSFVFGAGSADLVNNHIPLDPFLNNTFVVTKTGNKTIVEIGDTIMYTVKAKLNNGLALSTIDLVDNLPAGFKYVPGTATQSTGGAAFTKLADPLPTGNLGPQLTFKPTFAVNVTDITVTYKVRVGVGAMQGDGINRVQGRAAGGLVSNIAQYKVKVTGGVFTNDACVAGKVFVDCNNNHIQDAEELGIPGVRMYMEDGTYFISDVEGKYSYCGISPKTHVLKVDSLTMPRGSRLTITSNRNAGDANSLFLDTKNGELIRADFAEGSCSNTVLEQVKARRTGGEVRAPETEKKAGPAIKFEGKSPAYPQQGTDSANQRLVKPRGGAGDAPVSNTVNDNPVQPLPESSGNTRGNNLRDQKGEAK